MIRYIVQWWGVAAAVVLVASAATFRTSAGLAPEAAAQTLVPSVHVASRRGAHHVVGARVQHPAATRSIQAALPTRWAQAAASDYQRAVRPNRRIRMIVVHVAEAPSATSVVHQFQTAGVEASAHYVVSRAGRLTQMVPDRSIAWHAGNPYYNKISIGIEHAGYTNVRGSITQPEYRASARLVAHLAETYDIPLDRQHVIGHNEVPDPRNPRLHGGFDHHTDPGRYWNWGEYMRYAHLFAEKGPDALQIAPGEQPITPPPSPTTPVPIVPTPSTPTSPPVDASPAPADVPPHQPVVH